MNNIILALLTLIVSLIGVWIKQLQKSTANHISHTLKYITDNLDNLNNKIENLKEKLNEIMILLTKIETKLGD